MTRILSLEETKNCLVAYRKFGDENALNLLITCNMGLVHYFANIILDKYLMFSYNRYFTYEDFESFGMEALFKAIKYFDYENYGIEAFTTYVSSAIIREIRSAIKKSHKYTKDLCLNAPIDQNKDEDDEFTLGDTLIGDDGKLINNIIAKLHSNLLKDALSTLTARERTIIILRYGLVDGKILTQTEIAKRIGCSYQVVGTHEHKALRKLKHNESIEKIRKP